MSGSRVQIPKSTRGRLKLRSNPQTAGISVSRISTEKVMPWGSLIRPDFGRIRKDTGILSSEMDFLVRQYSPHDSVDVCRQRNKITRSVHQLMKTKKSAQLETELDKLMANTVPLDEITYISIIFGYLVLPPAHGLPKALQAFDQMKTVEYMHPSLLSLVDGFLKSLEILAKFDSFPNRTAVLKSYIPMREIATELRRLRMLGFRVTMGEKVRLGEIARPNKDK